jgi:hypothetical protein
MLIITLMKVSEFAIDSIIKSYVKGMKEEGANAKKPEGLKLCNNDIISISSEGKHILYQRVQDAVISRSRQYPDLDSIL